jgi:hypothetical protein
MTIHQKHVDELLRLETEPGTKLPKYAYCTPCHQGRAVLPEQRTLVSGLMTWQWHIKVPRVVVSEALVRIPNYAHCLMELGEGAIFSLREWDTIVIRTKLVDLDPGLVVP